MIVHTAVVVTVVIPAHNEGKVIGRLLRQLLPDGSQYDLAIIVVANGCDDNTAEIASSFGPRVRVIDLPAASKQQALRAGDTAATGFPRIYLDADVECGAADIAALADALSKPGVLAAAPERVLALTGCSWPVRWYYDIWSRLPQVRGGLFGRGVIGVNETGHRRIASLPPLLADDLAASLSFAPAERVIVAAARVTCHPPRSLPDLVRRRIRVVTGAAQLERARRAPASGARTHPADLAGILRAEPAAALRVALFCAVTLVARSLARRAVRRGDFSTWQRDDSSREPGPGEPAADAGDPA